MSATDRIQDMQRILAEDDSATTFPTVTLISLDSDPSTWRENDEIILPPDTPPFDPSDPASIDAVTEWLEIKYDLVGWYIDSDFYARETPCARNGTGFYLSKEIRP